MVEIVELEIGDKTLSIETGRVAKQADGSATVRFGDTIILATVVGARELPEEKQNFLPLFVDYREKAYAAGKIPGGFFKREGRPSEKEILSARLIDRSLRPLFPEDYYYDLQIMVMVLSSDQENDGDVLGINGASTALCLSDISFEKPVGAVRMGRVSQRFILNPTFAELDESDINLVIAGTDENIIMVEGSCNEVSEDELLTAVELGHQEIKRIVQTQKDLVKRCGKPKIKLEIPPKNLELIQAVEELAQDKIKEANHTGDKLARQVILDELKKTITERLEEKFPESQEEIESILADLEKKDMRKMISETGIRVDGRDTSTIRPITCEVGILPRTHGSALFTRGQTQSLVVTTLGTKIDEQMVDDLEGESSKSYMLHYNFPPFSVGERRPIRGPGRREIGHGVLAERAIQPLIPLEESFPYTIRLVSDILESNGSSSMATVCGGALSLMDAGVPIKASVAGIAMGLIKENDKVIILSDILGVEDHYGDMDFKVTGTKQGITAFQMDVKISGLNLDIIKQALSQAKEGRLYILNIMEKTIDRPRPELSVYAPRIITFKIKPEKIGDVIGPGGKTIRNIIEQTGAKIDIEDDGSVFIATPDQKSAEMAQDLILKLVEEPEIGKIYSGKVKKIMPFGAFVEFLPGQEGLIHISELDFKRVYRVEDVLKIGDEVKVKIIGIDSDGKIKLSKKACLRSNSDRIRKK
jgi:polyribonucleotide nucleotidyltransferase